MSSSDDFSMTTTVLTPPTECETTVNLWSARGAIPWPGNTFHIVEKYTNRMITLVNDLIVIKDVEDAQNDQATHWLCVEKNGYFGFQNPQSGRYIGHDGGDYVYAKAMGLDGWEYLTPREHPEGGYQLLSPFYWHTLKMLCVDEDKKTVVRRNHGTTLWEFVRI